MSKLERLLNLTAILLDTTRPLTADQLRTKIEGYPESTPSFRRAFERDKDQLRFLGIPLLVEKVPGTDPPVDGYRIRPEDYYLADPDLDPDELAALHLASMAVRFEGVGDQEAFWKLGGQVEASEAASSVAELPGDPNLVTLFNSISTRTPVRFTYSETERVVEPRRLDFQRGRWYLTGLDRLREAERNYRIERIDGNVELLSGEPHFERVSNDRPGRKLAGWELGDTEPVVVELLVEESRAIQAAQEFGDSVASEPHQSGGTVFKVPVINEPAFRSFAIGFLDHAEVLGPPEVRERMIAWLQQSLLDDGAA